ncbi:hypothetical protein BJ508DRAFT_110025 [Ascobolus immersus RN42]|uniref:NACHT domain-containing protein n=1 Tax=Ascobolus immersus RN42 TaxID=1160509 RepID=A0A3N4IBZ9_ASCIM|nr:hypothetical protein BJ508DRAFT_110025 [Ascobolus immersus RN42]
MTPRTVRTGDSDVDALTSGINTQPSSPPTTTAATKGFLTAIAKFKGNLTDKEKAEFDNITTEKHVWDSLKQIQSKQATKNRMLNMNRIKQFIEGLSRYMRLVSCIALGSHDIGAFIWGPLRRLLEKASDFADGFIAIMRSLEQIGEHLPRFEKYSELFKYDERIQEVISWLYGDILEFYLGVLEILRNKLWKVFFRMQWETFDARLNILIGNMKARRKLIDSEAQAAEIEAAQKHRSEEERRQREIEKDNELRQLAELGRLLYSSSSSDDKAGLLEKVCPGTGEWILTHDLVRRWLNGDMALIWITGKPGSGKSVISSIIANELEMNVKSSGNSVALYFFCRGTDGRKSSSLSAVQSLLYQYVEAVPSALPYVYDEVIMRRKVSQRSLATLFESILTMGDPDLPVFLLIDGLDELPIEDIRFLLKTTLHVTGVATSRKRVLVSSRRNVPGMEKAKPRTKKSIWAMEIEGHNDNDIEFYIRSELEEIIEDHDLTIRHPELAKRMVSTLIKGADGMFLWAHLVIDGLLKRRTVAELEQTLTKLPKELMDV